MKKQSSPPLVFFNASVVLAGLFSPTGGSAKLLRWTKEKQITGIISEIVLDEVMRRSYKIGVEKGVAKKQTLAIFSIISPPPNKLTVQTYEEVVIDPSDAHVLASAHEIKADFLVTLDKKHLWVLQKKIKNFQIVSPKELIETLRL